MVGPQRATRAIWTSASLTIMIVNVAVSPGAERLARAFFGLDQIPDVLEVLGWYDDMQADDVHRAVLVLSKGDMNALLDLVAAAANDFRDVLMWASLPEPAPEQREAARAHADAPFLPSQAAQRDRPGNTVTATVSSPRSGLGSGSRWLCWHLRALTASGSGTVINVRDF